MQFDLPLDQLRSYRPDPAQIVAPDFDEFWRQTLAEAEVAARPAELRQIESKLPLIDSYDLRFDGYGGQRIAAWINLPAGATEPLPCIVQFLGYGGGRGRAEEHLFWAAAGYAHIVMDTRGQGSGWSGGRGSAGTTPDIGDPSGNPQVPGMLTRGVASPQGYYYRRLFTDAVRLVREAKGLEQVVPERICVLGASQGGAIALAAASLEPVCAALIDLPLLCHVMEAIRLTDREPYFELVRYLRAHRGSEAKVRNTLSYCDGIGFAMRCETPALYSVGLMDDICPPRTVFAAYNHHAGPKQITVYPYAHHEGGEADHALEQLAFLQARSA